MIVVMGASLGGMNALQQIFAQLPPRFGAAIAVAMHRHREAENALLSILRASSFLPLREVVDKDAIRPGHIYLAPPDYHLLVDPDGFSLSTDEAVQFARPSIDVLFESAADTFGPEVIGVVLTGSNQDGAQGAARIAARGGTVLVQDPETAEGRIMPQAAIRAAPTSHVLPLATLTAFLCRLTTQAQEVPP